jgi:hypothetical protein
MWIEKMHARNVSGSVAGPLVAMVLPLSCLPQRRGAGVRCGIIADAHTSPIAFRHFSYAMLR